MLSCLNVKSEWIKAVLSHSTTPPPNSPPVRNLLITSYFLILSQSDLRVSRWILTKNLNLCVKNTGFTFFSFQLLFAKNYLIALCNKKEMESECSYRPVTQGWSTQIYCYPYHLITIENWNFISNGDRSILNFMEHVIKKYLESGGSHNGTLDKCSSNCVGGTFANELSNHLSQMLVPMFVSNIPLC